MQNPWFIKSTVPASGNIYGPGLIPLVKARTLSLTVRMTFNASGTTDAIGYVFYSPDGSNTDTVEYTSFDIACTAGGTVQRTVNIDPPEHGFISVKISNQDTTYTVTNVKVWYSIQSYEFLGGVQKGDIRTDTGEEEEKLPSGIRVIDYRAGD